MATLTNIILILTSITLNSAAQLCMRKGMISVGEISLNIQSIWSSIGPVLSNLFIWLSMACYAFSIITWIVVLSRVEVGFAYAFSSVGYILVALSGHYMLGESLSATRIVGIIIICFGVLIVAKN